MRASCIGTISAGELGMDYHHRPNSPGLSKTYHLVFSGSVLVLPSKNNPQTYQYQEVNFSTSSVFMSIWLGFCLDLNRYLLWEFSHVHEYRINCQKVECRYSIRVNWCTMEEWGCMVKKKEENEEGQDSIGSVLNIDLLSGIRSLNLVMNKTTCRNREAIFIGNMVKCRGIRSVALVPDDNVGLRMERGLTSSLLHRIYLVPPGLLPLKVCCTFKVPGTRWPRWQP